MSITNQKVLRMTFGTASGGTSSMTLPAPRNDVTSEEIQTVMQLIIDKNIFTGSGGDLKSIQDIKIVDTTTNDLYDPPVA
ncbi:MAG: DUF2922 domain-containing protein [Peptococcaceae bacterium]|nr:DUF2922 domain-containing protein [Peptococcaceae bacterium]